ncbi:hypothetical protein ACIQM4_34475 [Streptomyces sp. NPDC091272]|uniref:hypothetical protein n=1 Tax=Streptomyces sp. NPDC091272 TaxID=3365981 RepID=UPI00381F6E98
MNRAAAIDNERTAELLADITDASATGIPLDQEVTAERLAVEEFETVVSFALIAQTGVYPPPGHTYPREDTDA